MRTARRRMGVASVALGAAAWCCWLVWRLDRAVEHALSAALLLTEMAGLAGVVTTAVVLHRPRHGDVAAVPTLDRADRFRRRHADLVTLEGLRRVVAVGLVASALLLGVTPVGRPPLLALAALASGVLACSLGTWLLSDGRLRPGDRLAWSFAAAGLSLGGGEDDDSSVVPLRWAGVVGSIVSLNVAVALRGVSDRWTHGLPQMARDERTATMVLALLLVVGALVTLRGLAPPVATASVGSRIEERSARRTALAATAIVGMVGLLAGVLTDTADADEAPRRTGPTVAEELVVRPAPDGP